MPIPCEEGIFGGHPLEPHDGWRYWRDFIPALHCYTIDETCKNYPEDWADPEGFTCAYFEELPSRCLYVPEWKISRGKTALTACCACQGGIVNASLQVCAREGEVCN